jgi:hypothetical protein
MRIWVQSLIVRMDTCSYSDEMDAPRHCLMCVHTHMHACIHTYNASYTLSLKHISYMLNAYTNSHTHTEYTRIQTLVGFETSISAYSREHIPNGTTVRMLFDDIDWFPGTVSGYDAATGQYTITFDDGEVVQARHAMFDKVLISVFVCVCICICIYIYIYIYIHICTCV